MSLIAGSSFMKNPFSAFRFEIGTEFLMISDTVSYVILMFLGITKRGVLSNDNYEII